MFCSTIDLRRVLLCTLTDGLRLVSEQELTQKFLIVLATSELAWGQVYLVDALKGGVENHLLDPSSVHSNPLQEYTEKACSVDSLFFAYLILARDIVRDHLGFVVPHAALAMNLQRKVSMQVRPLGSRFASSST